MNPSPNLWPHLTRAIEHGFAIEFEPTARGTFVIRYRAAIRDTRYPATFRVRDHVVERESLEDAFRQVASVTSGELDIDEAERRAAFERMDREDAAKGAAE